MKNTEQLSACLAQAVLSRDYPYLMLVEFPEIEADVLHSIANQLEADAQLDCHLTAQPKNINGFEALALSSASITGNSLCPDDIKATVVDCFIEFVGKEHFSGEQLPQNRAALWLGVFGRDIKGSPSMADRSETLQAKIIDFLQSQGFVQERSLEGKRIAGKLGPTHSLWCYALVKM